MPCVPDLDRITQVAPGLQLSELEAGVHLGVRQGLLRGFRRVGTGRWRLDVDPESTASPRLMPGKLCAVGPPSAGRISSVPLGSDDTPASWGSGGSPRGRARYPRGGG